MSALVAVVALAVESVVVAAPACGHSGWRGEHGRRGSCTWTRKTRRSRAETDLPSASPAARRRPSLLYGAGVQRAPVAHRGVWVGRVRAEVASARSRGRKATNRILKLLAIFSALYLGKDFVEGLAVFSHLLKIYAPLGFPHRHTIQCWNSHQTSPGPVPQSALPPS